MWWTHFAPEPTFYNYCWGKPNIWILRPLLQKNKCGRCQLYRDQIFSHTIYLYNRKRDWCLIVDPIWLVWHTYVSHWSFHWTAHNVPDAPTKEVFLQKNTGKFGPFTDFKKVNQIFAKCTHFLCKLRCL